MELPRTTKDKLILDHLKLISSIMSDGIIIPSKTVRSNANSAALYLPRKFVGHVFKVILLPETEADKALFKQNNTLVERDAKIAQMNKQMKCLQTRIGHLQNPEIPEAKVEAPTGEAEDAY